MKKRLYGSSIVYVMACILATALVACGDDKGSDPRDDYDMSGCCPTVIFATKILTVNDQNDTIDVDFHVDSTSVSILNQVCNPPPGMNYTCRLPTYVFSKDTVIIRRVPSSEEISSSSASSDTTEISKIEQDVAAAIANHCMNDSTKADSLLASYNSTGNFEEATTSLADCAYRMTLETMDGDAILPSDFDRITWNAGTDRQKFKKAFYKFWQDDFGVGICNKDSLNIVKKNQDTLSSAAKYFICTDEREGFTSEMNWVAATDLQVNTYGIECDSVDYKEIRGSLDSAMYVCEKGCWRLPMDVERENGLCTAENKGQVKSGKIYDYICDATSWELNVLSVTDSRDNREFNALKIAGLLWMTENFKTDSSKYSWNEVMEADFCPTSWRIPTSDEWVKMLDTLGQVKANADPLNLIKGAPTWSDWWSATEADADSAISFVIQYTPRDYSESIKFSYSYGKEAKVSEYKKFARCVKDIE